MRAYHLQIAGGVEGWGRRGGADMIIDAHAHVSPSEYGSTEAYLELLRRGGIQRGVISPGGMLDVRRMGEFVTGRERPNVVPRNDYVVQSVEAHPLLLGFACVDPRAPGALEELARHLDQGFRGLMVSPIVHGFCFNEGVLDELVSLCGERQVPVVSHIAFRSGANTPDYVRLARRFPRTNFILEHMGAPPADQDATTAATELDNFFLETSLGSYLHIVHTVRCVGASKILFGSEFPLSHPALEMQKVFLLPVSDGERERILGGNIRELLRLD
jgi:uncharacterized protein